MLLNGLCYLGSIEQYKNLLQFDFIKLIRIIVSNVLINFPDLSVLVQVKTVTTKKNSKPIKC